MFEDLLLHPMSSLPVYAYLLRVLCGKDRYRHAEHVYNMLDLQRVKTVMG
jgi:pentatricopeptide repeat protein